MDHPVGPLAMLGLRPCIEVPIGLLDDAIVVRLRCRRQRVHWLNWWELSPCVQGVYWRLQACLRNAKDMTDTGRHGRVPDLLSVVLNSLRVACDEGG